MTYEEEQITYAKELKQVIDAITRLEYLLNDLSHTDSKFIWQNKFYHPTEIKYDGSPESEFKRAINQTTQYFSEIESIDRLNRFRQNLEDELFHKRARKSQLERLLSQTPSDRTKDKLKINICKTAGYVSSITPQHVSGKVYKVENGNGCGTFCLWFLIIDAIILFIILLSTS